MKQVPFASWDRQRRVWSVAYRSYEVLRRHWSQIEAAAMRNEPEERRKRQAQRRGSAQDLASRSRSAERRRRRYPLFPDDLPPLGRPVMTLAYGIVVFTGSDSEAVDLETLASQYTNIPVADHYVWGHWRSATLDELIRTWPARAGSKSEAESGIWWQPTIDELRAARKAARASQQRQR